MSQSVRDFLSSHPNVIPFRGLSNVNVEHAFLVARDVNRIIGCRPYPPTARMTGGKDIMTERTGSKRLRVVKSGPVVDPPKGSTRLPGPEPVPQMQLVEDEPELRHEKVAALRAAIASGAYEVDPKEVARKILEHGL